MLYLLYVFISVLQSNPAEEDISVTDTHPQGDIHGLLDTVCQQSFEETNQTIYEGFTQIELKEMGCDCRRQPDFKSFTAELGTDITTDPPYIDGLQNQVSRTYQEPEP